MEPEEAMLRYSFASSVILRDSKGRYLLGVNKNALEKRGEIVLTPIGGKVGIDPNDEVLFTALGAVFASTIPPDVQTASPEELFWHKIDPPLTDLVFRGPTANENAFRETFERYFAENDKTAKREMREELVDEMRVLRNKDLCHFFGRWWPDLPFSHVGFERAPSARAGGEETVRLMSFFDVVLPNVAQRRLEKRVRSRPLHQRIAAWLRGQYTGPLVYFVTEEEIRRGRTNDSNGYADGASIASIAVTMLKKD